MYGFIDKSSIDQNLKIISEKQTKENFYENDSEIGYVPSIELIDDAYQDKFLKKGLYKEDKKKVLNNNDSTSSFMSSNMSSIGSLALPIFKRYLTVKKSRASLINDQIIRI